MNFKRSAKRKKITFLIISDADSPVLRLHFSPALLRSAGAFAIALIVSVCIMYMLFHSTSVHNQQLQHKLSTVSDHYDRIISDKERKIETLQSDLYLLSEQAKTIERRMGDWEELEQKMESFIHMDHPEIGFSEPLTESEQVSEYGLQESGLGKGGEALSIPEQAIDTLMMETKESLSSLVDESGDFQNRFYALLDRAERTLDLLRVTPTQWPTDSTRVTSVFGIRKDPFSGRLSMHSGMDIAGPSGDPVYAAGDGIVVTSAYDSGKGYHIILKHPSGLRSQYFHLRKLLAREGEQVKQGDMIGQLGSTGRSTGPHLHFEIWKDGEPVDPAPYLITYGNEESSDVQR
ncbi:M23 family metallopeptidase [Paenibacillus tarimensis]